MSEGFDWIEEGVTAPDFTLKADDGKDLRLSELRGKPVVLYFYPKDETTATIRSNSV